MQPIPYFIVDAFTPRPFAGNPAAVVLLPTWPAAEWLQNVAREMNLAETAYLVPEEGRHALRWFTPTVEVDLCGHATLASAVVLARLGQLADDAEVSFATRSGILRVARRGTGFQLDFPLLAETATDPPPGLIDSLGVTPEYVGRNQFDYLVEVASEQVLRTLSPDFKQLSKVSSRGVMVTASSSNPAYDFVSRFFAPSQGIDEDPVTGSAHCCLADYWGRKLGQTRLVGFQASARGGVVSVEVRQARVFLGGEGVVVAQGELFV